MKTWYVIVRNGNRLIQTKTYLNLLDVNCLFFIIFIHIVRKLKTKSGLMRDLTENTIDTNFELYLLESCLKCKFAAN